jgi:hypothetical protein
MSTTAGSANKKGVLSTARGKTVLINDAALYTAALYTREREARKSVVLRGTYS